MRKAFSSPNSKVTSSPKPRAATLADPMALEDKKSPELDLQLISDDARTQLADILGQVEGKKDIVIQPQLLSLLDHVTPIGFLKR